MLHSRLFVAAVMLSHKKGLVSIAAGKGFSHELFRTAVVVFPGVIQERYTTVYGFSD